MNQTRPDWMNDYDRLLNDLKSRKPFTFWLELSVWLFLEVIAICGNGLTLKIIFCSPHLRTSSNFLIASLASADFCLTLLCSSMCIGVMLQSEWPYSDNACQLHGVVALTFACASVLNLTLMALNRYFRIVKTQKYPIYFTLRRTAFYIAFVWVASLIGSVSYIPTGHKYIFNPGKYFCYLNIDDNLFLAMVVTVYTALPAIIIVFCYYQVHKVISNHNQSIEFNSAQSLTVQEINITKTLFLIVVIFNICWMPIFIIDIIDVLRHGWSMPREAYVAYSFFAASSCSVNPILYGIMNPTFRKEYLKTLGFKRRPPRTIRQVQPYAMKTVSLQ